MSKARIKAATSVQSLILCMLLIAGLAPVAHAAGDIAVRSRQPIYIDGWSVNITAYNINGNNYVRLRDIGWAIDFDVYYDETERIIKIATQEPYSGDASALGLTPENTEVSAIQLLIFVDGREVTMLAYNIGGNNYVKLRDVAASVNFSAKWDAERGRVLIDTTKPYTPEAPEVSETTPETDIPEGTLTDHSLQANPAIFDHYYTRDKYNRDRQHVLDTGEIATGWGIFAPSVTPAVDTADRFFDRIAQMSDLEKVHSINDFLCAHMTYSAGVRFSGDDFWLSMAHGVCEDYAQIFRYMCYRAGIPCVFVTGEWVPATTTGRHAWNEVYFNDSWHFYDGTLSDSRNTIILSDTAESAHTGHTYIEDSPGSTMYRKELFVPGSTI